MGLEILSDKNIRGKKNWILMWVGATLKTNEVIIFFVTMPKMVTSIMQKW
jgi:hypothetical protein